MNWDFIIKGKTSICVSTDTRQLKEGCIFFALKGANFNGNLFAMQALEMGAQYVVVDEPIPATCSQTHCFEKQIIRVDNTLLALQDLARAWRRHWGKTVIAITGTNGKTTTKELTAAVLSTKYKVHYTQGNLNNQVGVPLTLLQLRADHDLAIIEMGASHPGDIKELVEIAEPDCGLITNVGKAHLQGFGSFEGVMKTKAELYEYLSRKLIVEGRKSKVEGQKSKVESPMVVEGRKSKVESPMVVESRKPFVFRNLDNQYLEQMMPAGLQTIGYHTGTMPTEMHLIGDYNAENVSAAQAVGEYFGVSSDDSLKAVRAYIPTNNRSQLKQTDCNTLIIDAYNANPTSMKASLLSFKQSVNDQQQITLILGDMLELGEQSHLEHQNIVNMLEEQKVENVLLVGSEFASTTAKYPTFSNVDMLAEYLKTNNIKNNKILIKGSRGIHLEKIIELL